MNDMKVRRINISVPEGVLQRLATYRNCINVSAVASRALEDELDRLDGLTVTRTTPAEEWEQLKADVRRLQNEMDAIKRLR